MNILKILTPKKIIGNFGEKAAAKHLKKNGYKILDKNYVALGAEIDIIAKKENVVAFIEVKTRSTKSLGYKEARPASSVTPEKQRKIIKSAAHYLHRHSFNSRIRLDVIEVYTEENAKGEIKVNQIKHIEGAFDKNTAFDSKYAYQRKKEGSNL